MENNTETEETIAEEVISLESEVKAFADGLPYWAKFLAEKLLSGIHIGDTVIETSYTYLLEELKLKEETVKPEILIGNGYSNLGNYKLDLLFTKLESVEGVNALIENQIIEFSPSLTIIYGSNGAGKSGYVRLLKKAFYSKAPEEIIPNIHIATGHKPINAKFTFASSGADVLLNYPQDSGNPEFEQYAVFDGKSVLKHLDQKNEFEFRPAGLGFFGEFTEAVKAVEVKLNAEVQTKQSTNDFIDLFEGESEIKTFVENLSDKTEISDLKKYTPFSEEDKKQKTEIEKQYDELLLASKGKEKEIKILDNAKQLMATNKLNVEALNRHFSEVNIKQIQTYISNCVNKEASAKTEGIERFKTDKIENIGTLEWKTFIIAAEKFAINQKKEKPYPVNEDNCLLCQQPLSSDAQQLITDYWAYIKSVAEQESKNAADQLGKSKSELEKLNFDLFPADNTLTAWLKEKHPKFLSSLQENIANQKTLATNIISDITSKTINNRSGIKISVTDHDSVTQTIDASIKLLKEDKQSVELEKLLKSKTKLLHREKLGLHFPKIEIFINNQVWIKNAGKANFGKRKITETEKNLSEKHFNQKYVDTFNEECIALNGNFGVNISHTGSGGKSYRQLKLKGNNPNIILSEGEQKVIALADFIAEMQLSELNRGIIFDDPVTSLDDKRKNIIAERLIKESTQKQVIIFTHDLVFVSNLISMCEETKSVHLCHWVECRDGKPGQVWLKNAPSYEKEYRNSDPVKKLHADSKKVDCAPSQREFLVKSGFTALRTCYEVLVINDLFKNVVQRYNERVSVDALSNVCFDNEVVNELLDSFAQCCRYMEGHTHSDKYAYKKPEPDNLNEEILRYEGIRSKIRKLKKTNP
jgi:ABC-type transport system involved in cytochrome c biogenesis ATPase subunit